ncbi:hypothetical protein SNEBB_000512 [Seison nebaliae]|nr:hypothetical protein SNEBB_000512 [Seison nebaliae]
MNTFFNQHHLGLQNPFNLEKSCDPYSSKIYLRKSNDNRQLTTTTSHLINDNQRNFAWTKVEKFPLRRSPLTKFVDDMIMSDKNFQLH